MYIRINPNKQYIVDSIEGLMTPGEIPSCTVTYRETDRLCDKSENYTWFTNSVNCVSKCSKALKQGVRDSVGVESYHTAPEHTENTESLAFLFFL